MKCNFFFFFKEPKQYCGVSLRFLSTRRKTVTVRIGRKVGGRYIIVIMYFVNVRPLYCSALPSCVYLRTTTLHPYNLHLTFRIEHLPRYIGVRTYRPTAFTVTLVLTAWYITLYAVELCGINNIIIWIINGGSSPSPARRHR